MEITLKNNKKIRGIYVSESEKEIRLFDLMSGCLKSISRIEIAALAMISFTDEGE